MCLVGVYLIKKKKANNLYKIIFIIGGERRKSFYRVLKKRGETGLIRKKGERKGFVTSTWDPWVSKYLQYYHCKHCLKLKNKSQVISKSNV